MLTEVTTKKVNPHRTNLVIMSDDQWADYKLTEIGFAFYHKYNERNRWSDKFYRSPHYELCELLMTRLVANASDAKYKVIIEHIFHGVPWTDEAENLYNSAIDKIHTVKCIRDMDMPVIKAIISDFGLDPNDLPLTKYDHQLQSLALYILLGYSNNWGQMRTGKTPPSIIYAYSLYMKGLIDLVLVVVPNTIKHIWHKELGHFTNSAVPGISQVIEGTKAKKKDLWFQPGLFKIVNYECLRADIETVHESLKGKRYALILDESHKVKNPSKQTYVVQELVYGDNKPTHFIALSGTPVANKPHDVVRVVQMTAPCSLGSGFDDFTKQYCYAGGYTGNDITGYKPGALEKIRDIISRFSVRVLREEAGMDLGKVVAPEELEMSTKQKEIHDSLKNKLRADLYGFGVMSQVQISGYLAQVMKLQEITGGFIIDNESLVHWLNDRDNPKIKWLDNFIEDYLEDIGKLVIACKFVAMIKKLEKRYEKHGSVAFYGAIKSIDRVANMERFKADPDCRIAVVNLSLSQGMDFNPAQFMVFMTQDMYLLNNSQTEDRITGFNQKGEATIIPLRCNKSIDFGIKDILAQKQKWFDAVMGDEKDKFDVSVQGSLSITQDDLFTIMG